MAYAIALTLTLTFGILWVLRRRIASLRDDVDAARRQITRYQRQLATLTEAEAFTARVEARLQSVERVEEAFARRYAQGTRGVRGLLGVGLSPTRRLEVEP